MSRYPGSQHEHDSECCTFLGPYQQVDIYWCNSTDNPNGSSVLGRYSDEGSDYSSSSPPFGFAGPEEYLNIAAGWYHRALYRAELHRGQPGSPRGPETFRLYTEEGWELVGLLYQKVEKRYGRTRLQYLRLGATERMGQPGDGRNHK